MISNKELAELLYPNAKPIEFWEKKYPKRNTQGEVTRFAPSPTGYVHVGHILQSSIDIALAKQTNGVSILRIEDTDRNRFVSDAVKVLFDTLKTYNLNFSEGTLEGGDKGFYAPYTQTDRLDIYHSFAKHLVSLGHAYPCFCTKEDEDKVRETQGGEILTGYYGNYRKCHNLTLEEVKANLNNGKSFTIRLRSQSSSLDEKIEVIDAVRGKMNIQRWFKDDILIKSDGIPVYHFAHIVDDYLMKITSVVRGSEWLGTYALHVEILNAFNFPKPKYYHMMLICKHDEDGNKVKFSKRKHPDARMSYYTEQGYPPEAIMEYLYTLLNSSTFEDWRKNNPTLPYTAYNVDFSKMNGTEALWDLVKLDSISKQLIAKMKNTEVYNNLLNWAQSYDITFADTLIKNKAQWIDILNIDRGGERPRADIAKFSDVKQYFEYFINFTPANFNSDEKKLLLEYSKIYSHSDDKETWWSKIKTDSKEQTRAMAGLLRKAITGRENTPDLFSIMKVLGEEEVIKRLLGN